MNVCMDSADLHRIDCRLRRRLVLELDYPGIVSRNSLYKHYTCAVCMYVCMRHRGGIDTAPPIQTLQPLVAFVRFIYARMIVCTYIQYLPWCERQEQEQEQSAPPSLRGSIGGPLDLGRGDEPHLREQGAQAVLVHLARQVSHEQRLLAVHRIRLARPAIRAQLHTYIQYEIS